MELKKKYEKMYYEELLKRYENLENYCDKEKIIILNEVKKRKLVEDEEIEKLVNDLNIELTTDSTLKENVEKTNLFKLLRRYLFSNEKMKIYEKKGFKYEYEWIKSKGSLFGLQRADGAIVFFSASYIILFIYSISLIPTLFFNKTEGSITKINDNRIIYEYNLEGMKYSGERVFMYQDLIKLSIIGDIKKGKIKKYRENNKIDVYYFPFNKNYSLLYIGVFSNIFLYMFFIWILQMLVTYSRYGVIYYRLIGWMFVITVEYLFTIIKMGGL